MVIILNDGTNINCSLNGNNYITKQDVSAVDFSDKNLKNVIADGVVLTDQHCSNVFTQEDGNHIIFRGLTAAEIENARLREQLEQASANLAYVAMVTDVDIPITEGGE